MPFAGRTWEGCGAWSGCPGGLQRNPEPDRFVRELVHATFQDSVGYVEDLTEACVDEYIAEIEEYYKSSGINSLDTPWQHLTKWKEFRGKDFT